MDCSAVFMWRKYKQTDKRESRCGLGSLKWLCCASPGEQSCANRLLEMLLFLQRKAGMKRSPFSVAEWVAVSFGAALPVWFWSRDPKELLCSPGLSLLCVPCCPRTCSQCLCRVGLGLMGFCGDSFDSVSPQDVTPALESFHSCSDQWAQHQLTGFGEKTLLLRVFSDIMFFYLASERVLAFCCWLWGWAGQRHHYQLLSFCCNFSLLSHSVVMIHIIVVILDRIFLLF